MDDMLHSYKNIVFKEFLFSLFFVAFIFLLFCTDHLQAQMFLHKTPAAALIEERFGGALTIGGKVLSIITCSFNRSHI